MGWRHIQWAWRQRETTSTERLVLVALASWADGSNECYPRVEEIVERTGLAEASVYRSLTALEEAGLLVRVSERLRWGTKRGFELACAEGEGEPAETEISHAEESTNKGRKVVKKTTAREASTTEQQGSLLPEFDEGQEDGGANGSDSQESLQRQLVSRQVESVWSHYVATMKPRRAQVSDEERALIRNALKVATVEELCRAINGCAASPFHMGQNDRKRRYNKLSQIIRGRQGKETTRERIDYFLDFAETSEVTQSVPSVDRALMLEKVRAVQRGHRATEASTVQEAKEAEEWLRQRGVEAVRRESDGLPIFPHLIRGPS